jgi:hypothetical protein
MTSIFKIDECREDQWLLIDFTFEKSVGDIYLLPKSSLIFFFDSELGFVDIFLICQFEIPKKVYKIVADPAPS